MDPVIPHRNLNAQVHQSICSSTHQAKRSQEPWGPVPNEQLRWHYILCFDDGLDVMGTSDASPTRRDNSKSNTLPQTLIRYTLSAEEYEKLYRHTIRRLPVTLRTKAPRPSECVAPAGSSDYNAAAVRASLRLFLAAQTGLKIWDIITTKFLRRGRPQMSVHSFSSAAMSGIAD